MLRVVLALLGSAFLLAAQAAESEDEDYVVRRWEEGAVVFPPAPLAENLREFEAEVASGNRFMVDASSLSVGEDGVVRYVIVIETRGGARNVAFEGIRCETREVRVYATGRLDGSWGKARNSAWERIRDGAINRYRAALFLDFFCPSGVVVRNADEARRALREGRHPDLRPSVN